VAFYLWEYCASLQKKYSKTLMRLLLKKIVIVCTLYISYIALFKREFLDASLFQFITKEMIVN